MAQYDNGTEYDIAQQHPQTVYYSQDAPGLPNTQYYTYDQHQQRPEAADAYALRQVAGEGYRSDPHPRYVTNTLDQPDPRLYHYSHSSGHYSSEEQQPDLSLIPRQYQPQVQHPSQLQSSGYSHGLGLSGGEATRSPTYQTFLPSTNNLLSDNSTIYVSSPYNTAQYHQNSYPASSASSPSLAGSRRTSLSDWASTQPTSSTQPLQAYQSTLSSQLPAEYNLLHNKASFDSSPSGSAPSSSGHGRTASLSQSTSGNHVALSAQGIITVYSAHPMSGPKGTPVNVCIGIAPHDPHFIRGFRVMYGHHGTTTKVIGERRVGDGDRVDLCASTPPVHLTTRAPSSNASVPLSLQALDEGGNVADWAELGSFTYTDPPPTPKSSPQKRGGSPLSSHRESPSTATRATFADVGSSPTKAQNGHSRGHSRNSSVGSLVNGFGGLTHHSRNSSTASLSSESESKWVSTPEGDLVERKPIARLRAPVSLPTSTPASSALRHPPATPVESTATPPSLYRTAQIPGAAEAGTAVARLLTTATLVFEGNLDLMALGWSHEEWVIKRRLVEFSRRQEGQNIIARFRPIHLQNMTPESIVISCIFREDENECFVTSVDTIYLLEALVAVRFTVEEKNRIRRNLEGFKPITIAKTKKDSTPAAEAFFKLIMSFPHPKPRNIEKDVKVFPWKTLSTALKKIVSKYSATYVTAQELATPGRPLPQPIGWAPGQEPSSTEDMSDERPGLALFSHNAEHDASQQSHPGAPSLATVPEHP